MKASFPVNELERIKKLNSLKILDSQREQQFDDIVSLAQMFCEVPIAVISLVDSNRQWFKACMGLDASETSRDVAFCAHAILTPDRILVVEDAQKDERFFDNALVTGAPFIRFYAGVPLVTREGFALGTLCVIDIKPRQLKPEQQDALRRLANQVLQLIRARELSYDNAANQGRIEFLSSNATYSIGELDSDQRYLFTNAHHKNWFGHEHQTSLSIKDIQVKELHGLLFAVDQAFKGLPGRAQVTTLQNRIVSLDYLPSFKEGVVSSVFELGTDITVRENYLAELQQERQRLLNVIEGTNAGIWEWNVQTGEVYINDQWTTMLGYSLAELSPVTIDTWQQLIHPDDFAKAQSLLERHFARELDYYDIKFRMKHKAYRWIWIHSRGRLSARDSEGNPLIMSGIHLDFSESKKLINDVEHQREFLRNILSNLPGTVYRCSAQPRENSIFWRVEFVSPNVKDMTGHDADYFIGMGLDLYAQQISPDDKARVFTEINSALQEHRPFKLEYRLRKLDGSLVTVEDSGRGVYDENGHIVFVDGFVCDIEERKSLQRQQTEMTKRLTNLFEAAPVGIIRVGSDLCIIEANPEMERLLGYGRHELCGVSILTITPEESLEQSQLAVERVKLEGRFGPVQKVYQHRDGSLIPVEISGAIISPTAYTATGNLSWWTLVKDMTEQHRIDKMKNEFISIISHELRTPLTSISGALGIVNSGVLGPLPDKAFQLLDIAKRNSSRLTALINDLLDMDKLMAGKMQFLIQPYNLETLVKDAIAENQSYTDNHNVGVNLIGSAHSTMVAVDQLRFQQVLSNFISNAAKFSKAGGHIDIRIEQSEREVKIAVQDFGIGISESFKSKIFTKFSQADASDTRSKGGTGLGLAISKELVERMGGSVGFASELGRGSCFFITFPVLDEVELKKLELGNQ